MKNSGLAIFIIALLIATIGVLSIYSCTYQKEANAGQLAYQRQLLWVILGIVIFLAMSRFNYLRLWEATYILYGVVIFLLFLVFLLGVTRSGAQRWLRIAWFNFQPSEALKLSIIIFLARYFSAKSVADVYLSANKFGLSRAIIIPFLFVAIPIGLVAEQPDLGTAVLILFIFIIMVYFARAKLRYLVIFLVPIIVSLPLLWHFLRDYQKDRLLVFLNPSIDPQGAGYTVIQSKIAIGSGGLFGKGWLSGPQSQLHFLPEAHTDFIFATFAEEWGFLGSVILLLLYYFLAREAVKIGLRTTEPFARLLALGISFALGTQIFINIAMNLGLAPVVGLPLPLMSYGGSSVFVTFLSLGILANISKARTVF